MIIEFEISAVKSVLCAMNIKKERVDSWNSSHCCKIYLRKRDDRENDDECVFSYSDQYRKNKDWIKLN